MKEKTLGDYISGCGVEVYPGGATRSDSRDRIDPEAALHPAVVEYYCDYIRAHRLRSDGGIRADDNWQTGVPNERAMKALWRHFLHAWTRHRGWPVNDPHACLNIRDDLCAIIFNAQVLLLNALKDERG